MQYKSDGCTDLRAEECELSWHCEWSRYMTGGSARVGSYWINSHSPVQKLCLNFWNGFWFLHFSQWHSHKIPFIKDILGLQQNRLWWSDLRWDFPVIESIFELSHLSQVIKLCFCYPLAVTLSEYITGYNCF